MCRGVNMKLFEKLFCKHDWRLIMALGGDIRNRFSGVYRCAKCGKETLK